MKILIVSHYFPPSGSIAEMRPYSWAKAWSGEDHKVTVLTTDKGSEKLDAKENSFQIIKYKNFYAGIAQGRLKVREGARDRKGGVKALMFRWLRFFHNFLAKYGVLSWDARFPNLLGFGVRRAVRLVDEPWDLVISTFAPYACHEIAYRLKLMGRAKFWIADYRDLWTESHLYKGLPVLKCYENYKERKINSVADCLTTVSEPLANRLRKKYNNKVVVVENGFDYEALGGLGSGDYFDGRGFINLVYTGSIYYPHQDPSPLLIAIKNIAEQDEQILQGLRIHFYGAMVGELEQQIQNHAVGEWVKYHGSVSREESLMAQRDADATIFLEFQSGYQGILTGKIFEYLSMSKRIMIIGLKGSVCELVESYGFCYCFGNDSNLMKDWLLSLLRSDTLVEKTESDDRRIRERFSRASLSMRMLSIAS